MNNHPIKILYKDGMDYLTPPKSQIKKKITISNKDYPIILLDCLRCAKAIEDSSAQR